MFELWGHALRLFLRSISCKTKSSEIPSITSVHRSIRILDKNTQQSYEKFKLKRNYSKNLRKITLSFNTHHWLWKQRHKSFIKPTISSFTFVKLLLPLFLKKTIRNKFMTLLLLLNSEHYSTSKIKEFEPSKWKQVMEGLFVAKKEITSILIK